MSEGTTNPKRPLTTSTNYHHHHHHNRDRTSSSSTTTSIHTTTTSQSTTSSSTITNTKPSRFRSKPVPPPKTAEVKRLERLLDGKSSSLRQSRLVPKNQQINKKNKQEKNGNQCMTQKQQSIPQSSTLLPIVDGTKTPGLVSLKRPFNVLTFRGGLSSAPTYKKAALITPLSSNNSKRQRPGGSHSIHSPSLPSYRPQEFIQTENPLNFPGDHTVVIREQEAQQGKESSSSSLPTYVLSNTSRDSPEQGQPIRDSGTNADTGPHQTGGTNKDDDFEIISHVHEEQSAPVNPRSDCPSNNVDSLWKNSSLSSILGLKKDEETACPPTTRNTVSVEPTTTTTTTATSNNNSNNRSVLPSLKIGLQRGMTKKVIPYNRINKIRSTDHHVSHTIQPETSSMNPESTVPSLPPVHDSILSPRNQEEEETPTTTNTRPLFPIHVPTLPPPQTANTVLVGDDHEAMVVTRKTSLSPPTNVPLSFQRNTITTMSITTTNDTTTAPTRKRSRGVGGTDTSQNDNFVRLNLKNAAGTCRGARKSHRHNQKNKFQRRNYDEEQPYLQSSTNPHDQQHQHNYRGSETEVGEMRLPHQSTSSSCQAYVSRMTGLDPMDDYLDGVYMDPKTKKTRTTTTTTKSKTSSSLRQATNADSVPFCTRHNRPCKLVVVKTNVKGNRGRKFYACSMPRGEQCDHFEWVDDTAQAVRTILKNNSSHSSFVARQVAAHMDRLKTLTLPELRQVAGQRRLNKNGKKGQLILRLALWTRDEITKAVPYPDDDDDDGEKAIDTKDLLEGDKTLSIDTPSEEVDTAEDCESASSADSSEDELEFVDGDDDADGGDEAICIDCDDDDTSESSLNFDDIQSTLVSKLKSIFGYPKFRDGQEWAIQRCLAGKRSLLIAPTGFGKSLCYSLPAALMDGVCIVISPLISLIQDQLRSLPPRIPAATLSGSISASATAAIIDDVIRKRIKILFVSPERLTSPSFRRLFNTAWNADTERHERRFPEISLLCVDEAHCVSQWAHNFRPCFLRFKRLLQLMEPKSVLAVTATAGPRVIEDITSVLGIEQTPQIEGVALDDSEKNVMIIDKTRDNIDVRCQFVDSHEERLQMLPQILKVQSAERTTKKNPFAGVLASGSVIVYVWRQRDTEVVAETLQAAGVKGGIVSYHGGMDASSRSKAQSKFMRGKARICVATVAFGMGIDKADVEGIIHLNLSSSPEHYLQEIGRAGRDGRLSQAIALPTIDEIPVRHSLAHSNFISESQIRCLLYCLKDAVMEQSIIVQDGRQSLNVALAVERLTVECDLKAETIETILSILEQKGGETPLLHVEGFNYDNATIAMKKCSIERLAEREPVAACIKRVGVCFDQPIGVERDDDDDGNDDDGPISKLPDSTTFKRHFLAYCKGSYAFSVTKCANALGRTSESRHVFATLRRLQIHGDLELALDTSDKGRVFMLTISSAGLHFFHDSSADFDERVRDITTQLLESCTTSILSGAQKVLNMNTILREICDDTSNMTQVVESKKKEEIQGKSSNQKFNESMSRYFGKGLLQNQQEDEDDDRHKGGNLPNTFSRVRLPVLENDLHVILRDLPVLTTQTQQTTAEKSSIHAPILGDSRFLEYTAVTVTKFLHGLDSPRIPSRIFQNHVLFGKWRQTNFTTILDAVKGFLQYPEKI